MSSLATTTTTATTKKKTTAKDSNADEVLTLFKECLTLFKSSFNRDSVGTSNAGTSSDVLSDEISEMRKQIQQMNDQLKQIQNNHLEVIQKLIYNKDINKIVDDIRVSLEKEEAVKGPKIVTFKDPIDNIVILQGSTFSIKDVIKKMKSARWNGVETAWSIDVKDVEGLKKEFDILKINYSGFSCDQSVVASGLSSEIGGVGVGVDKNK